jgi:hypothetical protein
MGLVVGNLSRKRDQIFRELHLIEKILFVAFLILVGASLEVESLWVFVVAAGYVVSRLLLKLLGTGAAMDAKYPHLFPTRRLGGLVYSAQGGIALAIAMDCALTSGSRLGSFTLAVVAVAVSISDITAVALTRLVLVQAGEVVDSIRPRRRERDNA